MTKFVSFLAIAFVFSISSVEAATKKPQVTGASSARCETTAPPKIAIPNEEMPRGHRQARGAKCRAAANRLVKEVASVGGLFLYAPTVVCRLLAPLRHADGRRECAEVGADRK